MSDPPIGTSEYKWMVVLGGLACFTMGFGIGANDVANNIGSAIGSGALSFRWALILAAVFELLGSVGLGASVTDAVKSGILLESFTKERPDLAMWSNLAALLTGTFWLIICSLMGLPVSTTHTVVGCLFGAGLAVPNGKDIIDWAYLGKVVISWFTSPILSMLVTAFIFWAYRKYVLRYQADQAIKRAKVSLWPTLFITFSVFGIFFVLKTPLTKEWSSKQNQGIPIAIGLAIGLVLTFIVAPLFFLLSKRAMLKEKTKSISDSSLEDESEASVELGSAEKGTNATKFLSEDGEKKPLKKDYNLFENSDIESQEYDCKVQFKRKWYSLPWFMDIKSVALGEDPHTREQANRVERFDPLVERYFAYLQVITASLACLTHGANDVANATAPFSGIYGLYTSDGATVSTTKGTSYWILTIGGAAIGFGVFFLGHRVIISMGFKLAAITPGRGFCMELATTLVMVVGSMVGIPLSSTHCKVGGTLAIGLLEQHPNPRKRNCMGRCNTGALNCKFILKIVVSWIATIVVSGAFSAALFALGAYAPSLDRPRHKDS